MDVLAKTDEKKAFKKTYKPEKSKKQTTAKSKPSKEDKAEDTTIETSSDDSAHEPPAVMPWENISQLIKTEILPELADEDGWANLADIGNRLYKLYSDFDSRNYGYSKLSELFKASEDFEIKPQPKTDPNSNIVYYLIREK